MSNLLATLSTCVIYGNESNHIERFIESFSSVTDEFVFVRAIGSRQPDDTLDKIKAKCDKEGIQYLLGEYLNGDEITKKWPHIDRFDKARQMSFDLATGDLRMWADCDDVLPPESVFSIQLIKNDPKRLDIYFGKYLLHSTGQSFYRERIVGRIPIRWISPVHENIPFVGSPTHARHDGLIIEHRPLEKPMPSLARNIKILEHAATNPHENDWEPHIQFYLHRDSWLQVENHEIGGIERCVKAGLKALSFPLLGIIEKYEVLLNLSEACARYPKIAIPLASPTSKFEEGEKQVESIKQEGFKLREKWLLNAFRLDPSRREALAALSMLEHDRKAYGRAYAYSNAVRGIPEPLEPKPWTHQEAFYRWKGLILQTLGLRRTNQEEEARKREEHVFGANGRIFSVLHATRRAEEAVNAMYCWMNAAFNASAVEWIFAVDEDDQETIDKLHGFRLIKVKPGGGPVAAWNEAAKESSGKILIQMSDDWIPSSHWDASIVQRLGEKIHDEAVLRISDGHRTDDLMCMAILTRKYYDRYAYVFYPEYFSMYSDNEFSLQAMRDDVVVDARDIVFEHFHPIFHPEKPMDEVYARSNAPEKYALGKAILSKRMEILSPQFEVVK